MRENINNPTHIIYYLVHLFAFIVGIFLVFFAQSNVEYKAIIEGVGASVMATAITGIVIFTYIKYADDLRLKVQMLVTLGLHQAFDMRGLKKTDEYESRFKKAKNNIDILGYGLGTFRQEHHKDFQSWKDKCTVRILLIDPEFPTKEDSLCKQRDIEEGNSQGNLEGEVSNFINSTKTLVGNGRKGSFNIRYFKCIPSITICRIDDEILWGPYFVNHLSRDTPMFIVKKDGVLYEQIQNQFENIWNSNDFSRPI